MNKLYVLGAYVEAPLVRETRLVSDLTMPVRDWTRYEEPPRTRAPHFTARFQDRMESRKQVKPDNVCMFHRRQAS